MMKASMCSEEIYKYHREKMYCHYVEYQMDQVKVDGYTRDGEKVGVWHVFDEHGNDTEIAYTYEKFFFSL